jgi:hypothetical protein
MVRDYLEELDIRTGFRLVYPRNEVIATYQPCFDRMCYQDVVFNAWVTITDTRKEGVLKRHKNKYKQEWETILTGIVQSRSAVPTPS